MNQENSTGAGFTLVELMVTMAILGVIMVGVIGLVTTQNKAYHSEESIIDMQMNNRIAMDHLVHIIRMTGLGCRGNISDSVNGFNTVISATDGISGAADELTTVSGLRKVGSVDNGTNPTGEEFKNITTIPIVIDDHKSLSDYFNDTTKKYFYISLRPNADFLSITSSGVGSSSLTKDGGNITVTEGNAIYTVKAYTISIKLPAEYPNPKPPGPNLVINENTGAGRQELAVNIENLQFQYGWDKNNDGYFDPNDSNDWDNDPAGNEPDIKAVRIYILARSAHPDREYTDKKQYKINDATASNAAVLAGPFNDNYHRFLLRAIVMLRNLNL